MYSLSLVWAWLTGWAQIDMASGLLHMSLMPLTLEGYFLGNILLMAVTKYKKANPAMQTHVQPLLCQVCYLPVDPVMALPQCQGSDEHVLPYLSGQRVWLREG